MLEEKIEKLKKELEIAKLELEIKKVKKTVIEETVIKRVTIEEMPTYPNNPFSYTTCDSTNNKAC